MSSFPKEGTTMGIPILRNKRELLKRYLLPNSRFSIQLGEQTASSHIEPRSVEVGLREGEGPGSWYSKESGVGFPQ